MTYKNYTYRNVPKSYKKPPRWEVVSQERAERFTCRSGALDFASELLKEGIAVAIAPLGERT